MRDTLFPSCVIPGCSNPVSRSNEPCGQCKTAFGEYLRPGGEELTDEQIEERDTAVRQTYERRGFA
ncbi:hypothetical protein [Rhodococcus sp. UNC363MFTsu5.1]|uniref:hypothetical protein n=1 Tax=Rhodococcus sp. UNC363MFTsu5.1 TaxID=1449069 RepID=UPI00068CB36D|nr:hypothetical protein [Rhodococcus sp. UNC363MFTsu5.1]